MNKDVTLEDLGYELQKKTDREVWYLNKNTTPVETNITFIPQMKYFTIYKRGIDNPCIDIKELQAIYNKCKELGWFDE